MKQKKTHFKLLSEETSQTHEEEEKADAAKRSMELANNNSYG